MSRTCRSNDSGSEAASRVDAPVQESGSQQTENHIDVLLRQYLDEQQSGTSPLPRSQYVPTGIFHPIHPSSHYRPVHDDFISLRRPNNAIHYSNYTQHPRTDPSEIISWYEDEDDFAHSDLPVHLLGIYDAGPVAVERRLGAQRFINHPEGSVVQHPVAGRFQIDESSVDTNECGLQTLQKTYYRTAETVNSESVNCSSGAEDDSEVSSLRTETTYLSSSSAEEQVLVICLSDEPQTALESTSGYMTAPLTAEGLGQDQLQPEQLESFQTLQKVDEKEPVEHSLLPPDQQPELQPLASEGRAVVPPGQHLARQLCAGQEAQVEHEEEEVEREEEEDLVVERGGNNADREY